LNVDLFDSWIGDQNEILAGQSRHRYLLVGSPGIYSVPSFDNGRFGPPYGDWHTS